MIKDIHKELEEEYKRFIDFGGLLDRKMRMYLIQYLQNKFDPERNLIPELNDRYFSYFQSALDDIFIIDGLQDVVSQNALIKRRIILDIIYWLKKTYKKARKKHPFEEEERRLESWSVTPTPTFIKRWKALIKYLEGLYRQDELDSKFYEVKMQALITSVQYDEIPSENQKLIEMLIQDILAKWDAQLYAKILLFQLQKFEEEKETYIEFVSEKVSEYNKLREIIEPFSEYFGWDMSRKLWQKTSFNVIEEYRNLLENEEEIKKLADLLGKMREAELEMEEESLEKTIVRMEWVKDETMKSEIVGIHTSSDMNNMLSSEASLLQDDTEEYFLKKYADKKLLTFKYEDRRLVKSVDHIMEVNQRIKQKEKGPFIICVDTSESMNGIPEKIAKVMTLGILKMAMNQNRRAYLINFSIGVKTLDLYNIAESIDEIAAFLSMSFYGGTDATLALYEALRQLENENYMDADVLMVSDFIMYKLEDDVKAQIKHYQINKNTQFHALSIGDESNADVLNYFDTNWQYDTKHKGIIKSLTKGLKDIGERM